MSNEYRIEKDRAPIVVTTIGGAHYAGDVFVQLYARHRHGREEPADIMNNDEPFFPLALHDGETLLVAKDGVAEVEILGRPEYDPASDVGARLSLIEVTLIDGSTRQGGVYLEVSFDRPRLLDFLNRFGQRFLALYGGDGVRLISRRRIQHVRSLD